MGVKEDMRLVERVIQQLAQLEKIILHGFSIYPKEELLGQKIIQFEMIINCLPMCCTGPWVQEYKDKLAMFSDQLESLTNPPPLRNEEELEQIQPLPENVSSNDLSDLSSSSMSLSYTASSKSLDVQMKNAFLALPRIKNMAEIDKIKDLLALAANFAKVVNESNNPTKSPPSLEDIFRRVLRKLPADLREEFNQRPEWQHSTHYLLGFLRNHISKFQSFELEMFKEAALADAFRKLDLGDKTLKVCIFCKTIGHYASECVFRVRQLCFNCYQFGHLSKKCALVPVII